MAIFSALRGFGEQAITDVKASCKDELWGKNDQEIVPGVKRLESITGTEKERFDEREDY